MAAENLPPEFFTTASIFTLTGATGAVYVVCGAFQRAFGFNPRWLAMALSMVIALAGAWTTQPQTVGSYLIALVNGCLIFCTAVGVNEVFATTGSGGPGTPAAQSTTASVGSGSTPTRGFKSRWR